MNLNEFLKDVDPARQKDIKQLHKLIVSTAPSLKPRLQDKFIAYGEYHYKYASGREGVWFVVGISKLKSQIGLYFCVATEKGYLAELNSKRIGKASCGKSCIRFNKLDDLNLDVIQELLIQTQQLAKDGKFAM